MSKTNITDNITVATSTTAYLQLLQEQPSLFVGDITTGEVTVSQGAKRAIGTFHSLITNNDQSMTRRLDALLEQAIEETRALRQDGVAAEFP